MTLLHDEYDTSLFLSGLSKPTLISLDLRFKPELTNLPQPAYDFDKFWPLQNCVALQRLVLSNAYIEDFSPLDSLLLLNELVMSDCKVANMRSSLRASSLTSILLDRCYGPTMLMIGMIDSTEPLLAHLPSLTSLSITNSSVYQVKPLGNHPSLVNLDLSGTYVLRGVLGPLRGGWDMIGSCSNLSSLCLNYVEGLTDINWISTLTCLTTLGLKNCTRIENLNATLSLCPSLRDVDTSVDMHHQAERCFELFWLC